MKLRRLRNPERGMRAMELLGESQEPSDFSFNLETDIPAKVWREVDRYLARESDPGRSNLDQSLLRLAMLDPKRAAIVASKPFFAEEVRQRLRRQYESSISGSKEIDWLVHAARFQAVLGSVGDVKQAVEPKFQTLLEQQITPIPFSLQKLQSLIQLYPERRNQILKTVSPLQAETFGAIVKKHLPFNLNRLSIPDSTAFAADLITLFPEEQREVLEMVRPYWGKMKQWLQDSADFRVMFDGERTERNYEWYADMVTSLNILAKAAAELERPKALPQQELPQRLIA